MRETKDYFKKQIEEATPLTIDRIVDMSGQVDGYGNKLQPGNKELYCLIESIEVLEEGGTCTAVDVVKILDVGLDEFAEKYEFVRETTGTLTVFKLKEET